jgi:hypothetical protein
VITSSDEALRRQLSGHAEAAQFDRGRVLLGGQQDTVRLQVSVHDAVSVAVPQRLQDLTHVVTETENESNMFSFVHKYDSEKRTKRFQDLTHVVTETHGRKRKEHV